MKSIELYNDVLPNNILTIINSKCLNQAAIARKTGIGVKKLSDMLHGRRLIKPCDIVAIADALEVTPNDLFLRKDGQHERLKNF